MFRGIRGIRGIRDTVSYSAFRNRGTALLNGKHGGRWVLTLGDEFDYCRQRTR